MQSLSKTLLSVTPVDIRDALPAVTIESKLRGVLRRTPARLLGTGVIAALIGRASCRERVLTGV